MLNPTLEEVVVAQVLLDMLVLMIRLLLLVEVVLV